jgi:TRAP-type uncharacterized transport system fused permease subunit
VLYFAVLSAITPPVAMAVYAANGISRGTLMQTSWAAVKLGLTGYIIPFMFVSAPSLLLMGDVSTILWPGLFVGTPADPVAPATTGDDR